VSSHLLPSPSPSTTLFPYTTLFRSKWRLRLAEFTRRSELQTTLFWAGLVGLVGGLSSTFFRMAVEAVPEEITGTNGDVVSIMSRSEEHTSELQSLRHLVCRLLLEKK